MRAVLASLGNRVVKSIFLASVMWVNWVSAEEQEPLPDFDCVIEPSEIADLGSAVPGVIGKIYAKRSDSIKKGQVVAELDSSVASANVVLSKARAELNTSISLREESAAFGNRTSERNHVLYQKAAISKQEIDKLDTENRIAQLQVLQERDNKRIASLTYERAKAVLDRHLIRSPIEGVVMERFKSVGEYVEDDPVMRVAQLDPLHVEVILPVKYMGRLAAGRRAEVTPSVPGYFPRVATVTRVDKVADAASGTFGVRLSLPNPGLTIPGGLRCSMTFLPPEEIDFLSGKELITASDAPGSESDVYEQISTAQEASSRLPEDTLPEATNSEDTRSDEMLAEEELAEEVLAVEMLAEELLAEELLAEEQLAEEQLAEEPLAEELLAEELLAEELLAEELLAAEQLAEELLAEETLAQEMLAEEITTQDPSPIAQQTLEPADPVMEMVGASDCYRAGPLFDELLTADLSDSISELDSTSEPLLDIERDGVTGYLVFATFQPDNEAYGEVEEYLMDKGVEDFYRMGFGEQNHISFGFYGSETNAMGHQESLTALGIEAEVSAVYRETYWINLSFNSSAESQIELQSLVKGFAPAASVQLTRCSQQQLTRIR